ncbi:hypothetical protein CC86DRAFT_463292 [Ophiobolus disseminans]|uniref:Heterokaryon incompatibility domain-containing protein n=1 Tax=Ophiobolus disseminans TaxID=1469910 RepID=A0A6A7ADV2_9PLEO|nr:hypothetical protein CC86DRAFT_463292 [Ophiobolus disseminans]
MSSIYGKLNHAKNEIRVIEIEQGRWDDDISCRLKVVSLDRLLRPRYDTLSYTWGSSTDPRAINVNKQTINVSANLFEALRALRHTFKTVTIWADALCIDQTNNPEKSKQVELMGRIYKQGRQTWVSLGSPHERWADGTWSPAHHLPGDAHVLKRLMRGIRRVLWHHLMFRRSRQSRLGANHVFDAFRLMRGRSVEDELDNAGRQNQELATAMLTWLVTHDYWSRVWIVQEIALSQKDPICVFGRHQVPLLSLDTIVQDWRDDMPSLGQAISDWWKEKLHSEPRRVGWSPEVGKGVDRAQEICMLRDEFLSMWKLRYAGSMPMLRALQIASHRRASVAHDHVYGLRSLLPGNEQELLQPDYDISIPELYPSVTKLLLRNGNSASLLCAAVGTSQQNEHELPSWSLDFSQPLRLPVQRTSVDEHKDPNGDNPSEPKILRLRGNYLGEYITTCLPRSSTSDMVENDPVLLSFLASNIYEEDKKGGKRRKTRTVIDQQHHNLDSSSLHQRYVLFSTDQGSVGKCASDVQQGDEIWAFAGSKTVFVLRPMLVNKEDPWLGKRYRLVGSCDFFGQGTDDVDTEGRVTQTVEII